MRGETEQVTEAGRQGLMLVSLADAQKPGNIRKADASALRHESTMLKD